MCRFRPRVQQWDKACTLSNIFGYMGTDPTNFYDYVNVTWQTFRNFRHPLTKLEFKIRPVDFEAKRT